MKIAHISDLHLNTFFKNSNLKNIKYLIKYTINMKVDHIVITGDLTDNATPGDFEILRNLFRSCGILRSDRLSVVIGNHDIFGGLQTPEDIFSFPEKCSNVDYDKMVNEFCEYFSETFLDTIRGQSNNLFPYVKEINNIQLAGINSIARYSRVKNPFASNGKITDETLIETDELLKNFSSSDKTRLALVHHHFNKLKLKKNNLASGFWQKLEKQTMKLKKKKRIITLLKKHNINLVLHGHWHLNMEYEREGIRFFNGGATIKGIIPEEIQINFIDIRSENITMETHKLVANSSIIIHRNVQNRSVEPLAETSGIKIAANF